MVIEVCIFAQFAVCKNGLGSLLFPLNTLECSKIFTVNIKNVSGVRPKDEKSLASKLKVIEEGIL